MQRNQDNKSTLREISIPENIMKLFKKFIKLKGKKNSKKTKKSTRRKEIIIL